MKNFEIRFKHSKSRMTLTETVTASSYQYARESLKGRYDGLQVLNWRQV